MILTKALLVSNGNRGMNISFTGYRKINEQFMSNYEDLRKDKLPVPTSIRNYFKQLRYFFLTMVGLWDDVYTKYLSEYYTHVVDVDEFIADNPDADREETAYKMMTIDTLFQKTIIVGFEIKGEEIKVYGKYENIDGKPFTANLPFINETDDYAFFHEALETIKIISEQVMNYMRSDSLALSEIKNLLLEMKKENQDDVERIETQSDEENLVELMNKLEGQALVFPLKDSKLERMLNEKNDNNAEPKIVSNGKIAEGKVDEHEEVEETPMDANAVNTITDKDDYDVNATDVHEPKVNTEQVKSEKERDDYFQ